MSRTLVGGLLAFLMVGPASPANAQTAAETPLPGAPVASAKPRYVYESLAGYGAVAFRGGILQFMSDPDIKKDAKARPSGDLVFTYVYDDNLFLDVTAGYAWNRLGRDTNRFVVSSVPITLGARYVMRLRERNRPFIGAGGGLYIWTVHTRELDAGKDPITFERLRRGDLGFYFVGGADRRMSQHISASADITYHQILAKDTADFPAGYNGNKSYLQARLGITFFFTLSERISELPE
jgi:outer membrane protein W